MDMHEILDHIDTNQRFGDHPFDGLTAEEIAMAERYYGVTAQAATPLDIAERSELTALI